MFISNRDQPDPRIDRHAYDWTTGESIDRYLFKDAVPIK